MTKGINLEVNEQVTVTLLPADNLCIQFNCTQIWIQPVGHSEGTGIPEIIFRKS